MIERDARAFFFDKIRLVSNDFIFLLEIKGTCRAMIVARETGVVRT